MSLDKDIDRLGRVSLFSALDYDALRLMAFAADKRVLETGDILFREGEMGESGYLVISGAIGVGSADADKAETRRVGPGSLIGEHALLAAVRRPVTASALEPSSVLTITRRLFTRVLHEYPSSAKAIRRFWARTVADRLSHIKD